MGIPNEGSSGTSGGRESNSTILSSYVAGSVTAITLASAAYLFYLRCQHRGTEPQTTAQKCTSEVQEVGLQDDQPNSFNEALQARGPAASSHTQPTDAVEIHARGHHISPHDTTAVNDVSDTGTSTRLGDLLGRLWSLWRGGSMPSPHLRGGPAPPSPWRREVVAAEGPDTAAARHQDQNPGGPAEGRAAGVAGLDVPGGEQGDMPDAAAEEPLEEAEPEGVSWRELLEAEADEPDAPDEFRDPISLAVMQDPVVLCATGQVYEYGTLRNWFRTGNRLCPKTNIEVLDVQVIRVPWFKARIHEWLRQHGRPPHPPPDPTERLARLHPSLAAWVHAIRNDTGERRSAALADLYEALRQWEAATAPPPAPHPPAAGGEGASAEAQTAAQEAAAAAAAAHAAAVAQAGAVERLHKYVRGAVLDEAVWLLRHGNPYLQGVAASVLAYCDTAGEVSWLAATAAVPAVSLCMSQNRYTSQAATRLLYNLARGGQVARRALVGAGAVTALISVLATDRQEYGYCRDRAAATLALLIRDADGRSLLARYGLPHLVAMVRSGADRWEQRDAATVLLKLGLSEDELRELQLSADELVSYWCCSRAWLEGQADDPSRGYTAAEKQAQQAVEQLRAGTLTHAALAGLIADQDADLHLTGSLDDADDPWAEDAHDSEEAAAAWRAMEEVVRLQLAAAAEVSRLERQEAAERRRRAVAEAGPAAAGDDGGPGGEAAAEREQPGVEQHPHAAGQEEHDAGQGGVPEESEGEDGGEVADQEVVVEDVEEEQ
ncbi:hypothetical protein Agub_g12249 [Astrephomene gubernaculifera]|uniref:RING-type E3 ubiquitin transferase n=1 Tax=Astrephomene gubernaculifera TaxID=47775 RepID=A0AAD3HR63_9CHLO|nr:hypothetical protein Agub_g12249 [Astrephomene gubernaculifera]